MKNLSPCLCINVYNYVDLYSSVPGWDAGFSEFMEALWEPSVRISVCCLCLFFFPFVLMQQKLDQLMRWADFHFASSQNQLQLIFKVILEYQVAAPSRPVLCFALSTHEQRDSGGVRGSLAGICVSAEACLRMSFLPARVLCPSVLV